MRFVHDFEFASRITPEGDRRNDEPPAACLVVAVDDARADVLCKAARAAGWTPIDCDDVPSAVVNYERKRFSLVIVDLVVPPGHSVTEFRGLLDWFARKRRPVIIICGHEGDSQEEIWARRLGPMLYLTGRINGSALSVHLRHALRHATPVALAELPD